MRTFRSLFDIFARAKFEKKIPNYPGKLFVTPRGIDFCFFFVFPLFDSIGFIAHLSPDVISRCIILIYVVAVVVATV